MMKTKYVCAAAAVLLAALSISCQQSSSSSVPGTPSLTADEYYTDATSSAKGAVRIRWNAVSGAASYTIYRATVTDGRIGTYTLLTSVSAPSVSFDDTTVTEDTSYSYKITASDSSGTEGAGSNAAQVSVEKGCVEKTDWLLLFYADGDNNLSPVIWRNVQQACNGLADMSSATKKKIKAAVLWDGTARAGEATQQVPSGTYLFDLKAEKTTLGSAVLPATDYSSTASWLRGTDRNQEVNMADPATLTKFLLWAQGRYSAERTVLVMSDHGAGSHTNRTSASDRTLCFDNTAPGYYDAIQTTDFPSLLTAAGYGPENSGKKLDLVIFDACLEGTLENAYELKDYASYFLASPNLVPGNGLDYDDIISSMGDDTDVAKLGKNAVSSYALNYSSLVEDNTYAWTCTLERTEGKTIGGTAVTAANVFYTDGSGFGATLTLMDMSGIDAAASAVNGLAAEINKKPAERKKILDGYLKSTSPLGNTFMYCGTYTLSFDTGFFAYWMDQYGKNNSWPELSAAAENAETALSAVIKASWRDGYSSAGTSYWTYYNNGEKDDGTSFQHHIEKYTLGNWFGIAMCGGNNDTHYWYGIPGNGVTAADTSNTYESWYQYLDCSIAYPEWNTMLSHLGD